MFGVDSTRSVGAFSNQVDGNNRLPVFYVDRHPWALSGERISSDEAPTVT